MKFLAGFQFSRRRGIALALVMSAAVIAWFRVGQTRVPDSSRPKLLSGPSFEAKRGVALSNWIGNARRQPIYVRDMVQLRSVGFERVRIPIDPDAFSTGFETVSPVFEFSGIDRAVELAVGNGLNVILNVHPRAKFMDSLERSDVYEANFVRLWGELIERYEKYSPKQIAFELLNEPHYYSNPARYNKLIAEVVSKIRSRSSTHTLVIGGTRGSSIDGLKSLDLIKDPNVLYAFHFYEPYIITHQGVWRGFEKTSIRYFENVPYPSSLVDSNRQYAIAAPDPKGAAKELSAYVDDAWDYRHILNRIQVPVSWAASHNVHVVCTEFGVLRTHIDAASRYRWIRDVRRALEEAGVGWDVWDYSDLFGIVQLVGATRSDPVDGSVRFIDPAQGLRKIEGAAIEALFR